MTPTDLLTLLVARLRPALLREPVRFWLYGLGAVIAGGLVLAGMLTDEWETFLLLALGQLLALPAGELSRLSVYAPRTLIDAGVLRDNSAGRHDTGYVHGDPR